MEITECLIRQPKTGILNGGQMIIPVWHFSDLS